MHPGTKNRLVFFMMTIAFIFTIVDSCVSSKKISKNVFTGYDSKTPYYLYQASLFYTSDSAIELLVRIPLYEFAISNPAIDKQDISRFTVTYTFFPNYRKSQILDSASVTFTENIRENQMYWKDITTFIQVGTNHKGFLHVSLRDQNHREKMFFLFQIDSDKLHGNQHYFRLETKQYGPTPQNHLTTSDTFRLMVSPQLQSTHLQVARFRHFNEPALPPYGNERQTVYAWNPDTIFNVPVDSLHTPYLNFRQHGIYHFMPFSNNKNGFTVFITREDFPFITTYTAMSEALKYIATSNEYNNIIKSENLQSAIENFWTEISQNENKAKKNIKEFYNRVQLANIYFTSYKEGWMTDRGMVFIVLGKPDIVYKSFFSEQWIYGVEKNINSSTFTFHKVLNPLSDNDFILVRSPSLRDKWLRAIEAWRK